MQKFSSKKDWWVIAFLVCLSGLLIQLLLTMHAKGQLVTYPLHTITYIVTVLVIWWPIFNTRYTIDDNELKVKCLFLKWNIPLNTITNISKTNNSEASPALSLDRVKVEYVKNGENKFILLSPRQQQQFIELIRQHLAS